MLQKVKSFGLIFGLISIFSCAQTKPQFEPKHYIAFHTIDSIIVDGIPNENSWNKIDWSENFIDIEGIKEPKFNTKIKMLWNENHLFVFAALEEPHIWASIKKRDEVIFHNNDFEIFLDPDGDTHNYYEIEMNALNTIWDLFLTKPYREGTTILNDWTATDMKTAVKINGTINNANDIDTGWTIEMAIPWSVFKKSYYKKNIPKDNFWRINFSRVNWDFELVENVYRRKKDENGKLLPEYNWVWSPMGVIDMHEPEKWGYVYFSSKKAGEKDNFKISNDERIKWKLYELHRKLKKYHKKNKSWATSLEHIQKSDLIIDGMPIKPTLENHSQGYNLTVLSPFSKKLLILGEDGKFKIK